jgi:hypothetical protein
LSLTKYWRRQNIGGDKILAVTEIIGGDKFPRRLNSRIDKISAATKSRGDKISASTKSRRRQNAGADAEEAPYCFARQSPQLLTSPRPR